MIVERLRQSDRSFGVAGDRLEPRLHASQLLLDLADVAQVLVEDGAVFRAQGPLQPRRLLAHRIEQALLLLQRLGALIRRPGFAEHALEGDPRVDAHRQRTRLVTPGEGVEEGAGEAVARPGGRAHVLGADLERSQRRIAGHLIGNVLVHGLLRLDPAERIAGGVARRHRSHAVQEGGAGTQVHGLSPGRLHAADGDERVAKRLERLHHRLELEVAADLGGMPRVRKHAVRQVDGAETERRRSGRAALGRDCRHHRVEERQRHGGAHGALQERTAGQVLFRDVHGYCALATRLSAGWSVARIRNGTLLTIPVMIEVSW